MKKTWLLISIIMISTLLLNAQVAKFVCEEYPPYEYLKSGTPAGSDVDVINAVCKDAGINYVINFYPWKRCIFLVDNKQADAIFGILKNNDRLKIYNYPEKPINLDKRIIITRKGYAPIKSINDLKGKTVGIVSGYAYSKEFDGPVSFTKDESNSSKQLIEKFVGKRVDIIAINENVFNYYKSIINVNEIMIHEYVISQDPLFLAFGKSSPYYEKFNKSLTKLTNNGQIKLILNKYK